MNIAVQNERQPRNTATLRPETFSTMDSHRFIREASVAVGAFGLPISPFAIPSLQQQISASEFPGLMGLKSAQHQLLHAANGGAAGVTGSTTGSPNSPSIADLTSKSRKSMKII